jgi:hypothetical protein
VWPPRVAKDMAHRWLCSRLTEIAKIDEEKRVL